MQVPNKNLRNRPTATEHSDIQAQRGTGQLNSINAYLRNDPVSYFYKKFSESRNEFLRDDFWSEAARRGESDNLASLLAMTDDEKFNREAYDILDGYGDRMDYDNYMMALQIPHLDNTKKTDRVDEETNYSFGQFTDQEWAMEILKYTIGRWDAEIIEEAKANRGWLVDTGVQVGAGLTSVVGGASSFVGDVWNLGEGILNVLFNWSATEKDFLADRGEKFLGAFANDDTLGGWSNPFGNIGEWLQSASYEWQRKYATTVNAVAAHEQGYRYGEGSNFLEQLHNSTGVGAGYTTWGRYFNGATNAIGYMIPTIVLGKLTAGASTAGTVAGKTATVGTKIAAGLNKGRSLIFYAGIFSGSVKDTVTTAQMNGISYKDLNSGQVIANSMLKSAAQYAIEVALGAVLGFSGLDKMLGFSNAATRAGTKAARGAVAGGLGAVGRVGLNLAKDAVKEGIEETLQELSDMAIDYTFGGDYRKSAIENFSLQTLSDAFIIGAMSSLVMGSVANIAATAPNSARGIGMDADGTFKMGMFQTMNLRDAMVAMNQWNDTINSDKASIKAKAEAMLKLNAAIDTLGELYRNMGTERAMKADAVIMDMLAMQNKVDQLAELKTVTAYTNKLWNDFKAAQNEASTKYIKAGLEDKIKKAIAKESKRLKEAKVTELGEFVTAETDANDPNLSFDPEVIAKLKTQLNKLGVDILLGVDNNIVLKSDEVAFVNLELLQSGDIENIVKGMAYQIAQDTVISALSTSQRKLILSTYNSITGLQGTLQQAVTALLFDSTFYTHTLLRMQENWRYKDKAFEVLATIDTLIKSDLTDNVKKGTVTERAYKALMEKVQKTMQTGLVTFATVHNRIDLGTVDNAVLPIEVKQLITNHRNVIFSNTIDAGLSQKSNQAPLPDRVAEYDTLIDKYGSSITAPEVAALKQAARSSDYNSRVDAYMALVRLAQMADVEHVVYLPIFENAEASQAYELIRSEVEARFGLTWAELVSGNYDANKITAEMADYIMTNGYDMSHQPSRIALLSHITYETSGKFLTVTDQGNLMVVLSASEFVKPEYLGETGQQALRAALVNGTVKTIGDLVVGNLDINSALADIKIIFDPSKFPQGKKGFYTENSSEIYVSGLDLVNTIMHELTHYTQNVVIAPSTDSYIRGGGTDMFKAMAKSESERLTKYTKDNFPLTYAVLGGSKVIDHQVQYFMLAGELQAYSTISSVMMEAGFTWRNNKTVLVSPDGKETFSMKAQTNSTVKAATKVAKAATSNSEDIKQLKQLRKSLTNLPKWQGPEVKTATINNTQTLTAANEFYGKYPALKGAVEGKATKTAQILEQAIASKSDGLSALYNEMYLANNKGSYDDFMKTPILFARSQLESEVTTKALDFNSVYVGYDADTISMWNKSARTRDNTGRTVKSGWADNMLTGTVLPSELITYLPQSGTEAFVTSKTLQAATVTKAADVSTVVNDAGVKRVEFDVSDARKALAETAANTSNSETLPSIKAQETKAELEMDDYKTLLTHLPKTAKVNYELGTDFNIDAAIHYEKYSIIRKWLENTLGTNAKDMGELHQALTKSKSESLNLLYQEIYQGLYDKKGSFGDFINTPLYYVMAKSDAKDSNLNIVSLGYDTNKLSADFKVGDNVYYGSILPNQLTAYLPLLNNEGVISSKMLNTNDPIEVGKSDNVDTINTLIGNALQSSTIDPASLDKYDTVYEDSKYKVVDFNDTHYLVGKNVGDDYHKVEILSKASLEPAHNHVSILTKTERDNLLDFIAGNKEPFKGFKKKKTDEDFRGFNASVTKAKKNGPISYSEIIVPRAMKDLAKDPTVQKYMANAYLKNDKGEPIIFLRGFAPWRLDSELHNLDGIPKDYKKIGEFYTTSLETAQTFAIGKGLRGFITNLEASDFNQYDFKGLPFHTAGALFTNIDKQIHEHMLPYSRLFKPQLDMFRLKPNFGNLSFDQYMLQSKLADQWTETIDMIRDTYKVDRATAVSVLGHITHAESFQKQIIDTLIPLNVLQGHKAIIARNVDEGKLAGEAAIVDDIIMLYGAKVKRVTFANNQVNWSEDLNSGPARYISNAVAKQSNLKYFIKKGTPIQLDSRVASFVSNTTTDFNKLPIILKDKIKSGQLTRFDIIDYVATAKNMNDYTFQNIARYVYENEALAQLKFKEIQDLMTDFVDLAAISNVIDSAEMQRTPLEMKAIQRVTNRRAQNDTKLSNELIKALKRAETVFADGQYHDSVSDLKQLMPIIMNHYDGTLRGIRNINNLGKYLSFKQETLSLIENVDTGAVEQTASTTYNWIDRIRRAEVEYKHDNDVSEALDDIDRYDKISAIEDYITNELIARVNKMSQEQKVANLDALQAELATALEGLENLSDEALDKRYLATLANEVSKADDRTVVEIMKEVKSQPRSTKNIKDHLRQAARTVTRRIAGLKRRYNMLPSSIKDAIDPKTYKLIGAYYTNMTDAQLETLLTNMKEAARRLNTTLKAEETAARVAEQNQARLTKLAAQQAKTKVRELKAKTVLETQTEVKSSLRDKLKVPVITKVTNQKFVFDSREAVTSSAKQMLSTQWAKQTKSKVKGVTTNATHNVHNGKVFFENNADILLNMTTADAEATVKWFMDANLTGVAADGPEAQTFAAIKLYYLGYVLGQAKPGGQFHNMSANLRNRLETHLSSQATVAGTALAVWNNIQGLINPVDAMMNASMEIAGVILTDAEKESLLEAAISNDMDAIAKAQQLIISRVNVEKTTKKNIYRVITTLRSMMMLSNPVTWLRNIGSNVMLKRLNIWASKIGSRIASNKTVKGQFKMDGKVTPQIQSFINEHFIDNKMFDTIVSNLSRYNPSDIQSRFKDATGKASKDAIFANMVIKSLYSEFYNQNTFKNKHLNNVHRFLMKMLSDNNYVREASVRYFGKIIAERGYALDQGVTDGIMNDFANAIGMGMADYMHSDNFFNSFETMLAEKSEAGLFAYKLLLPFGSASWNWFKAAVRFSPVGLGQSIYKMAKLEQQIIKAENAWAKGTGQVSPEMTEYLIRRDLGSGVIGTTGLLFGMLLAGLGYVELEEEDYGVPKLRIGNLRIDVSTIFGSSSVLAGMALVKGFQDDDYMAAFDAMLDPMLDGFFLVNLLEMDQYNNAGWGSFGVNFLEQTLLSFIPNGVRWLSGATYTGKYKTNNFFERAVARIPFFGSAFGLEKRVNPYTGDMGDAWDIFNRVVPFFEVRTTSTLEKSSKELGVNKAELRGSYEIDDEKFELNTAQVAELNKAYGQWNADALVEFYDNRSKHSVRMPNGSYRTLSYNQMSDEQRKNAVANIFNKHAQYAKIKAWLEAGNTYYASTADYAALRRLGVKGTLYKGNKGFVKN